MEKGYLNSIQQQRIYSDSYIHTETHIFRSGTFKLVSGDPRGPPEGSEGSPESFREKRHCHSLLNIITLQFQNVQVFFFMHIQIFLYKFIMKMY